MSPGKKSFQLPMTLMFLFSEDSKTKTHLVHALDFDLICTGKTEEEATKKIRLAVKSYIEYGLNENCPEDIVFPAPPEYWDLLLSAEDAAIMPPIKIMERRIMAYRVPVPVKEKDSSRKAAISA